MPGRLLACALTGSMAWAAVLGGSSPSAADIGRFAAYRGPQQDSTRIHLTPTASKPQNKLWWQAGAWWGLLYTGKDHTARIAELRPDHTWRLTDAVVARNPIGLGDAVSRDGTVHILIRTDRGLTVGSWRFRADRREYRRVDGSTHLVATRSSSSAALAMDTRGRLWAAYTISRRLWLAHSGPGGRRWTQAFVPDVPGAAVGMGEIADLVAFDGSIGVMWSNQRDNRFVMAVHRDTDNDSRWSVETPLRGPGMVDDHISLQVVPGDGGDTVLAAVKTSLNDRDVPADSPLVMLLRRTGDGWSQHVVATIEDNWTRPVLAVDTDRTTYVVARRAGSIVLKSASLDDLRFPPGRGQVVMAGSGASFTDPTVPTGTVDSVCGLVVLASDLRSRRYWHAEMAIDATPEPRRSGCRPAIDAPAPPERPNAVVNQSSVRLTWDVATESAQWLPAGDARAVLRYTVFRDAVRIGSTSQTAFLDTPSDHEPHEYAVSVVDASGRRSEPSEPVQVRVASLAGSGRSGIATVWLAALLVTLGCALAGAYVHGRTRARRGVDSAWRAFASSEVSLPMLPAAQGKHARGRHRR